MALCRFLAQNIASREPAFVQWKQPFSLSVPSQVFLLTSCLQAPGWPVRAYDRLIPIGKFWKGLEQRGWRWFPNICFQCCCVFWSFCCVCFAFLSFPSIFLLISSFPLFSLNMCQKAASCSNKGTQSGVAPANQRKGRNKKFMHAAHFCENSGVFPWENKRDSHLELSFQFSPGKVDELAFLWFCFVCRGDKGTQYHSNTSVTDPVRNFPTLRRR